MNEQEGMLTPACPLPPREGAGLLHWGKRRHPEWGRQWQARSKCAGCRLTFTQSTPLEHLLVQTSLFAHYRIEIDQNKHQIG